MKVFQQGEIYGRIVEELPQGLIPFTEKDKVGNFIISHSEKGHHHVLGGDVEVMERTQGVEEGMRILYAIVKEPTALKQNAPNAHEEQVILPGKYEFRISRQWNSFARQARRVAD